MAWEFAQYAIFFARTIIFHSVLILNFARTNTTGKSLLLCHAEIDFENLQLVIFFYYGDTHGNGHNSAFHFRNKHMIKKNSNKKDCIIRLKKNCIVTIL